MTDTLFIDNSLLKDFHDSAELNLSEYQTSLLSYPGKTFGHYIYFLKHAGKIMTCPYVHIHTPPHPLQLSQC